MISNIPQDNSIHGVTIENGKIHGLSDTILISDIQSINIQKNANKWILWVIFIISIFIATLFPPLIIWLFINVYMVLAMHTFTVKVATKNKTYSLVSFSTYTISEKAESLAQGKAEEVRQMISNYL